MKKKATEKRIKTKESVKINGKSVKILDVKIDSTTTDEVLNEVRETIEKNKKLFIVTPNPEIVLQAQTNKKLLKSINSSDISVPDGVGLLKANRYLDSNGRIINFINSFYISSRRSDLNLIKGRELFIDLIKLADKKSWKVILIGNKEGSAERARKKLEVNYTNVKLYATEGANLNSNGNPVTNEDTEIEKSNLDFINKIQPQLVFVGFGAPRQEIWLNKWLNKMRFNVGMVVGGTFDYISGKVLLPPIWWPQGMEWFWRMFTQFRFKRIANAVFVFPITVYQSKNK